MAAVANALNIHPLPKLTLLRSYFVTVSPEPARETTGCDIDCVVLKAKCGEDKIENTVAACFACGMEIKFNQLSNSKLIYISRREGYPRL
jgi:hypothetical protein